MHLLMRPRLSQAQKREQKLNASLAEAKRVNKILDELGIDAGQQTDQPTR